MWRQGDEPGAVASDRRGPACGGDSGSKGRSAGGIRRAAPRHRGLRGPRLMPSERGRGASAPAAATLRRRGRRLQIQEIRADERAQRVVGAGHREERAPAGAGLGAGRVPGAACQIAVAVRVRPGLPQPARDPRVHPAAHEILLLRPIRAPDRRGDLAVRPALRVPFQGGQQLAIPVPRARPGRGAGTPDQRSSIRITARTSSSPASSGNASPPGRRTWTAAPGRSAFSTSAPSASRRPASVDPPAAASATRGAASRTALPTAIGPRAQKGETGPSSR